MSKRGIFFNHTGFGITKSLLKETIKKNIKTIKKIALEGNKKPDLHGD